MKEINGRGVCVSNNSCAKGYTHMR